MVIVHRIRGGGTSKESDLEAKRGAESRCGRDVTQNDYNDDTCMWRLRAKFARV